MDERKQDARTTNLALLILGLGVILVACALGVDGGSMSGLTQALLVGSEMCTLIVIGLLIARLREDAERVKREVERG